MRLELTSGRAATCFQDKLLIQPDDLRIPHFPFRIPKSSGGWNRTNDLLVQSQASLPAATAPDRLFFRHGGRAEVRGEGLEPPSPGSKPGSLPLADPRSVQSALRESNSPRQLGRLEPLPLGQGHMLRRKGPTLKRRCPNRTPKALVARPLSTR